MRSAFSWSRAALRLVVLAGGVAAAAALTPSAVAGPKACHPGVHNSGSVSVRTFCGSGSATVKVGGKTLKFKGGTCERATQYFDINLGTIVLSGTPSKRPDYFGITVGRTPGNPQPPAGHDGTYTAEAIAFLHKNRRYALLGAKITLKGKRTRGSFSGTLLTGGTASGSFRCS